MWHTLIMNLAYEYASRGACLALSVRREDRLQEVADCCHQIGAPNVIGTLADVSSAHDCKRMVDQTVHHLNRCVVDHLVNNAGISEVCMLEEADDITNLRHVMDVKFCSSAPQKLWRQTSHAVVCCFLDPCSKNEHLQCKQSGTSPILPDNEGRIRIRY